MFKVSAKKFDELVGGAIERIPEPYVSRIQNVAFLIEEEPTPQQRKQMNLSPESTLLGLYEGTPLPARGGATKLLPDKITLFKKPLEESSTSLDELKNNIARTLWHEVAHYFGLDHRRIWEIEQKI